MNDELPSFRHKNIEKDTHIFDHRGVRHEFCLLAVKGLILRLLLLLLLLELNSETPAEEIMKTTLRPESPGILQVK